MNVQYTSSHNHVTLQQQISTLRQLKNQNHKEST